MITTALYPTSYFPPLSYMISLVGLRKATIEIHETFPKQTLRNRAIIPTANGTQALSVPVQKPNGTHSKTEDIIVCYYEKWNIIHWRSIMAAYNASPYFLFYADAVEDILTKRYERLIDLNHDTMVFLLKSFKIGTEIEFSQQYILPEEIKEDHRQDFSYKSKDTPFETTPYSQVFEDRQPFNPNVSSIDLLFNLGPEAHDYLISEASIRHRI